MTTPAKLRIAYQGEPGANSHIACLELYPQAEPVALATFEEAFAAVEAREVAYAMIPVENSVAGRVADIHHLMPDSNLHIVGEHFLRVRHQLLAVPGATLDTIREVASHVHALGQCRKIIARLGLKTVVAADTAGAAAELARSGDKTRAAQLARTDYVDVQISLDGATPEVNDYVRGAGSFDTAIRALNNLKNAGFTKLVRRDRGVYENVTALDGEKRYMEAGDKASLPHIHKKVRD